MQLYVGGWQASIIARIGDGGGHGLFAEHVLAGFGGADGVFGVHGVGQGDVDGVDGFVARKASMFS